MRNLILSPQRIGLAESERQDWVVTAEKGTTVEDILEPGYWAHVAAPMQPFDHIEVRLETGEWVAELIVQECDRMYAKVHLMAKHELTKITDEASVQVMKHSIEWKGPHHKWSVIRISDSAMIQNGFLGKAQALVWLENHEKVTA